MLARRESSRSRANSCCTSPRSTTWRRLPRCGSCPASAANNARQTSAKHCGGRAHAQGEGLSALYGALPRVVRTRSHQTAVLRLSLCCIAAMYGADATACRGARKTTRQQWFSPLVSRARSTRCGSNPPRSSRSSTATTATRPGWAGGWGPTLCVCVCVGRAGPLRPPQFRHTRWTTYRNTGSPLSRQSRPSMRAPSCTPHALDLLGPPYAPPPAAG